MLCAALGTNDLGYGESADTLLPALLGMHDRARATGARTIALSIPQFALELVREGGRRRKGGRGRGRGRKEEEGWEGKREEEEGGEGKREEEEGGEKVGHSADERGRYEISHE